MPMDYLRKEVKPMKKSMTVLIAGVLGVCFLPTAVLAVGDHKGQFCWTGFQYDCHKPCTDSQGQIGVGPFTGTVYYSWKVTANSVLIKNCKPSSNPHQHCCTRNVKCGDISYYGATGCPPNLWSPSFI